MDSFYQGNNITMWNLKKILHVFFRGCAEKRCFKNFKRFQEKRLE